MAAVSQALGESVRGRIIELGDPDYDEARSVYNGMIDKKPEAVVQVADVADVVACVNHASESGLDLAIRGGGHCAPGFGTVDDGLVIDFVNRRGVRVDARNQTARAEAGCTWADFNHATHAYGLATPGGIVGSTGVAGLTLGGGIGYLARKHGLSCDNLLSADVVTAEGKLVTASATENEDLFWALRGGSGNFGVVTSLEFQLHPVDVVHTGIVMYGLEHAQAVGEFYREHIASAPEEFGAFLGFHLGPPVPFLPEEWHGKPVVVVVGMWTGDLAEGESRWQPYLDVAPVAGSMIAPLPYPFLNGAFDPLLPKGMQAYWKAAFMPDISDGALAEHQRFAAKIPSVPTAVHLYPIGGAVARVATSDTAFEHRDGGFAPVIACMWDDPADNAANTQWVRDYYAALQPYSDPGGYINFMDADDQSRVGTNYGANYAKLQAVKKTWDPGNLFHVNQNIAPG
jgi:FAD/FMN-containing dehydrogenase